MNAFGVKLKININIFSLCLFVLDMMSQHPHRPPAENPTYFETLMVECQIESVEKC